MSFDHRAGNDSALRLFRINAETVGYAIDVVEVSDHLRRIVDRPVVESDRAQPIQIFRRNGGRG